MPSDLVARTTARSRWAVVGITLAVLIGGGGVLTSSAASPTASSFVPITPCRLLDTRPGTDNVGSRATPLGSGETHVATVWGTNGNCTIPTGATGVSMNVAIVNPTAASFLTVFPSDQPRPLAASLNWVAGQAPTPNAVTAALSTDGRVGFYNLTGTVDLAVDLVGYYEPSTSGPAGPQGPAGPPGPGVDPAQVVWVAKSGGDFTSIKAALASITDNSSTKPYLIRVAPGTYDEPGGFDLENYVDIEGAGQDVTTITCACGSTTSPTTNGSSAVVRGTGPGLYSEVRSLRLVNTGGSTHSTGVWLKNNAAPLVTLREVALSAFGGSTNSSGIHLSAASPRLEEVSITTGGGSNSNNGISLTDSSAPVVQGATINVSGNLSYGILVGSSSRLTVHSSSITLPSGTSIFAGSGTFTWVTDSFLTPDAAITSSTEYCSGNVTTDFVPLSASCN